MTAKEYLGQAYRIDQAYQQQDGADSFIESACAESDNGFQRYARKLYKKYPPYGRCYNQNRGYGKRDKRRH